MKTGSRELQIISVADHRKKYLPLLFLADEQEDMIDRYLAGGDMYVLLLHGAAAGVCLVKEESSEDPLKTGGTTMKMLHVTIQTNKFEEEMEFYEKEVGLTLQRDLRPAKDLVFFVIDPAGVKVQFM